MTILGIDTSNQSMALSLFEDGHVLATYLSDNKKNHSTTLMPGIEFIMSGNHKKPKDLTQIIVAEGPGSYTGLRIGVTTAKTLAWSLGIELISVSTLALIASGKEEWDGLIVPIINARRENVYTGAYRWQNEEMTLVFPDHHTSLASWLETLKAQEEKVFFIGMDVPVFQEMIREVSHELFFFSEEEDSQLMKGASFIKSKAQHKVVEDIETFVPNYLKKVEAEENWLKTHKDHEDIHYVERV